MRIDWEKISAAGVEDDASYLQTDEFEDMKASLILLRDSLSSITKEKTMWKWAIIAAHSALQGACVCILTRTDGVSSIVKRNTEGG